MYHEKNRRNKFISINRSQGYIFFDHKYTSIIINNIVTNFPSSVLYRTLQRPSRDSKPLDGAPIESEDRILKYVSRGSNRLWRLLKAWEHSNFQNVRHDHMNYYYYYYYYYYYITHIISYYIILGDTQ
jgi:hypothetical protein